MSRSVHAGSYDFVNPLTLEYRARSRQLIATIDSNFRPSPEAEVQGIRRFRAGLRGRLASHLKSFIECLDPQDVKAAKTTAGRLELQSFLQDLSVDSLRKEVDEAVEGEISDEALGHEGFGTAVLGPYPIQNTDMSFKMKYENIPLDEFVQHSMVRDPKIEVSDANKTVYVNFQEAMLPKHPVSAKYLASPESMGNYHDDVADTILPIFKASSKESWSSAEMRDKVRQAIEAKASSVLQGITEEAEINRLFRQLVTLPDQEREIRDGWALDMKSYSRGTKALVRQANSQEPEAKMTSFVPYHRTPP